jgi:hypothetical protein
MLSSIRVPLLSFHTPAGRPGIFAANTTPAKIFEACLLRFALNRLRKIWDRTGSTDPFDKLRAGS